MAEKKFKDIGEAYAILGDPQKRKKYDLGQDIEEIEGGRPSSMDPNEIFSSFFGGNPFGGSGGQTFTFNVGGGGPQQFVFGGTGGGLGGSMPDIFNMFGGMPRAQRKK